MSGHSVFVHVWLIFAICYYCCETLVLSARMYSLYTKGWKYWPYLIQTVMSVQAPDLNELANSGVGTMGTGGYIVPPRLQDLYPLYPPSQRCGLCQNFKQTTLATRLCKVRTNLYPPTYENVPTRLPANPGSLQKMAIKTEVVIYLRHLLSSHIFVSVC